MDRDTKLVYIIGPWYKPCLFTEYMKQSGFSQIVQIVYERASFYIIGVGGRGVSPNFKPRQGVGTNGYM